MKTKNKNVLGTGVVVKLYLDDVEFPSGPFGNLVHLAFRELCERYGIPVTVTLVGNEMTLKARIVHPVQIPILT